MPVGGESTRGRGADTSIGHRARDLGVPACCTPLSRHHHEVAVNNVPVQSQRHPVPALAQRAKMGFGDSVKSLLETYSNCVSLLKSLRPPKSKGGDDSTKKDDQQVVLLKSLKKDRALVERAYSSRLSETGGKLRKGDGRTNPPLLSSRAHADHEPQPVPCRPWTAS